MFLFFSWWLCSKLLIKSFFYFRGWQTKTVVSSFQLLWRDEIQRPNKVKSEQRWMFILTIHLQALVPLHMILMFLFWFKDHVLRLWYLQSATSKNSLLTHASSHARCGMWYGISILCILSCCIQQSLSYMIWKFFYDRMWMWNH